MEKKDKFVNHYLIYFSMKPFLILLFSLIISGLTAQENQKFTGLKIDTTSYKKAYKREIKPGREILPKRFSLLPFAPPVKNQGDQGTCVGYSVAYCGMSTALLLEKGSYIPFSPMCLYNRIKDEDDLECQNGSFMNEALNTLSQHGASKWGEYPEYLCKVDYSYGTYPEQLLHYEPINVSVFDFKFELSKFRPIAFGMRSFWDTIQHRGSLNRRNVNEEGLWTCDPTSYSYCYGGHAMCIIGYDDEKFGGAFLVQNSWGENWGKDGYFWLPYKQVTYCEDFYSKPKYGNIDEAYSIHSVPNYSHLINPSPDIWDFEDDTNDPTPAPLPFPEIYDELIVINNVPSEYTLNPAIWLSIAYETFDGWISKGWWPCLEGEETSIDISGRISDEIYYRVEDIDDKKKLVR